MGCNKKKIGNEHVLPVQRLLTDFLPPAKLLLAVDTNMLSSKSVHRKFDVLTATVPHGLVLSRIFLRHYLSADFAGSFLPDFLADTFEDVQN